MLKLYSTIVLGCALVAAPAAAEEVKPAEAAKAEAATPFAEAAPLEETKLAKIAGREDVAQVNEADLRNNVTGNNVGDNSETGDISFRDNAFSNSNGFTIVNANSGNNVAINASIQVNVALPNQ